MEHYTIELPRGLFNLFKRKKLRLRLEHKLIEYAERAIKSLREKNHDCLLDVSHKVIVLQELLNKGRVDTAALARRIQCVNGFNWVLFERACYVIRAYASDMQGIVTGGTKLPE